MSERVDWAARLQSIATDAADFSAFIDYMHREADRISLTVKPSMDASEACAAAMCFVARQYVHYLLLTGNPIFSRQTLLNQMGTFYDTMTMYYQRKDHEE